MALNLSISSMPRPGTAASGLSSPRSRSQSLSMSLTTLERKGEVFVIDKASVATLEAAVKKKDVDLLIRNLNEIAASKSLDLRDDCRQPLHLAAYYGHAPSVKFLVQACGHDPNAVDAEDYAPLDRAAASGHAETSKQLIELGAQIDRRDDSGRTCLHRAAGGGHVKCCEVLVAKGLSAGLIDDGRGTPMHAAAFNGHGKCCSWLVKKGASPDAQDIAGRTPLHWCVYGAHASCAREVLGAGANPSLGDHDGRSPLHWAAEKDVVSVALELVRGGANIDAVDGTGATPLMAAAEHDGLGVARELMHRGCDAAMSDAEGRTALHWGAGAGSVRVTDLLVAAKPELVTAKDANRATCAHYAAGGHLGTLEAVLKAGADPTEGDISGRTALHWAAGCGATDCVQHLVVARNAPVNALDDSYWTPLDWAAEASHGESMRLIRENYGETGVEILGRISTRIRAAWLARLYRLRYRRMRRAAVTIQVWWRYWRKRNAPTVAIAALRDGRVQDGSGVPEEETVQESVLEKLAVEREIIRNESAAVIQAGFRRMRAVREAKVIREERRRERVQEEEERVRKEKEEEEARIEAERIEAERIEAERIEAERVEAERIEAERVEAERVEAERIEAERIEAERIEAERIEAERIEAERVEAERIEAERIEAERIEAERVEAERIEAERIEAERIEAERIEAERIEAERIEAERIEAERIEAERIEAERIEAERIEAERIEAERIEAERIEAERIEAERIEAERIEAERIEAERIEAERIEAELASPSPPPPPPRKTRRKKRPRRPPRLPTEPSREPSPEPSSGVANLQGFDVGRSNSERMYLDRGVAPMATPFGRINLVYSFNRVVEEQAQKRSDVRQRVVPAAFKKNEKRAGLPTIGNRTLCDNCRSLVEMGRPHDLWCRDCLVASGDTTAALCYECSYKESRGLRRPKFCAACLVKSAREETPFGAPSSARVHRENTAKESLPARAQSAPRPPIEPRRGPGGRRRRRRIPAGP